MGAQALLYEGLPHAGLTPRGFHNSAMIWCSICMHYTSHICVCIHMYIYIYIYIYILCVWLCWLLLLDGSLLQQVFPHMQLFVYYIYIYIYIYIYTCVCAVGVYVFYGCCVCCICLHANDIGQSTSNGRSVSSNWRLQRCTSKLQPRPRVRIKSFSMKLQRRCRPCSSSRKPI